MVLDLFRAVMRWLHLLAAVTWVGGSLFWLLVLVPSARDKDAAGLKAAMAGLEKRFRELVQLCIAVLVVTGAIITFDRLQLEPGPAYVVTLGAKIALAIWMFVLAQDLANRGRRRLIERRLALQPPKQTKSPTGLILGIGIVILFLSDLLKVIGPK